MADIRCPKCGKNNPDLLDVCQFCGTSLKSDSVLRIGESPTKKDTGELEAVLPDWLRDMRQQGKASAEEAAAPQMPQPTLEKKNEPPDLLAGLVSQSSDAEDDIPDWLARINPVAGQKPATPSTSAPESDFFAQFRQSEAASAPASKPVREEPPPPPPPAVPDQVKKQSSDSTVDELSQWFAQASEQPEETVKLNPNEQGDESAWARKFDAPPQEPAPKVEEDLSWLHNLEDASKQTGDLQSPKQNRDWTADFEAPSNPAAATGSQEDLSWLNNLGGIDEPQQPAGQPPFAQPFVQPSPAKDDDLSWLNNLGASEPEPSDAAPAEPTSAQPFVSQEDLGWLSKLGDASEPLQPAKAASGIPPASQEDLSWLHNLGEEPVSSQPAESAPASSSPSQEDLSWLNNLGGTPTPAQPFEAAPAGSASQDDLSWLNSLGGQPETQFTPPFAEPESPVPTASQEVSPFAPKEEAQPDWLKGAMETPSAPTAGDASLDWFASLDQPAEQQQVAPAVTPPAEQMPQTAPFADTFSTPTPGEPASLAGQDVDSLFSAEMPDWLSRSEPTTQDSIARSAASLPAGSEESLAPVDLPSWVQAMRPVEAVISETSSGAEEEPEEKQGPLAGLRGVIPGLAIGSSRRPKAISLKLQATNEQQASAALLDQILASETNPRALITSSFLTSQRWLRWTLAVLFLIVLGVIVGLRSNMLAVSSPSLPDKLQPAYNIIQNIPENGNVLVIVDYEPALAGEMEAVSGPMLSHLVFLHHPILSFVSTSTSGPGLVERLMTHTKLNVPISDQPDSGFGYVAGEKYFNLGYLPGGSAGVLGFVKAPAKIIPAVSDQGVQSLSNYAAVILMTDHAESGRVWVEQLSVQRQADIMLTNQPLLVIASTQADPLLQPYVASQQINATVSGLSDAMKYESVYTIGISPKTASSYTDAFGIGLLLAIALIVIGSLWSLFTGIRARRAEAE